MCSMERNELNTVGKSWTYEWNNINKSVFGIYRLAFVQFKLKYTHIIIYLIPMNAHNVSLSLLYAAIADE